MYDRVLSQIGIASVLLILVGSPNTFALERCSDPRLPCPMAALLLNFLINDNVAAMVNSQQLRLEQAMVASFPTAFVEHKKH